MKYLIAITSILCMSLLFVASSSDSVIAKTPKAKINWVSFEQAQELMKTAPKKTYVDMYTNWCHWCKVMDQKTFSNAQVIDYMNANYYCIKFNAESKAEISYKGKVYGYNAEHKVHDLAIELMRGKLSFPTSILFDENFSNGQPIPGYLDVKMMEMTLRYIGENKHKEMPWEKYQASFKQTWK